MTSVSVRSYLAAGVAAVGVGAVALSPVHPVSAVALAPQHATDLAVNLAAAVTPVDPVTAITNAIVGALDNVGTLANNWANGIYVAGKFPGDPGPINATNRGYKTGVPLPILQTVIGNALTYLGELPDIGTIAEQFLGNIGNLIEAPFAVGAEVAVPLPIVGTLNFNQNVSAATIPGTGLDPRFVWAGLPAALGDQYASIKPILDFTTTPISGLLIGAIGPVLAPVLSVINSVSNTVALLQDSDLIGALTEVINIPANAINAFLNGGQNLDLTPIVGLIGAELPEGFKIGLQMGGLLSPGGVAFDSLSATVPGVLTSPGLPVGPIGALLGLTNYVATAIKVTPPAPTASVRAAAADSAPEADAPAIEAPASPKQDSADPTVEVTSVSPDEPVAVVAERPQDDPAPAKQRSQARRGAAATGNDSDSAAKASAAPAAPAKAAASRRSAR